MKKLLNDARALIIELGAGKTLNEKGYKALDELLARINSALAAPEPSPLTETDRSEPCVVCGYSNGLAPEPDAMELVDKLEHLLNENQVIHAYFSDKTKSVALITDYGRRVPRAMLEEIAHLRPAPMTSRELNSACNQIADEFGVKVEG